MVNELPISFTEYLRLFALVVTSRVVKECMGTSRPKPL